MSIEKAIARLQTVKGQAIRKSDAESKIRNYMAPVTEHLAKIFVFNNSQELGNWTRSIRTALYHVVKSNNNVKSSGRLEKKHFVEIFNDELSSFVPDVITVAFDKGNAKMKALTKDEEQLWDMAVAAGNLFTKQLDNIAKIAQTTNVHPSHAEITAQVTKLADFLVTIAQSARKQLEKTIKEKGKMT